MLTWSLATIDPAIYVLEGRATGIWVQRLTLPEYIETVRSAVGVDIASGEASSSPPPLHAISAVAVRPSNININNRLYRINYFSIVINIKRENVPEDSFATCGRQPF